MVMTSAEMLSAREAEQLSMSTKKYKCKQPGETTNTFMADMVELAQAMVTPTYCDGGDGKGINRFCCRGSLAPFLKYYRRYLKIGPYILVKGRRTTSFNRWLRNSIKN